jgi:hypothetical protein
MKKNEKKITGIRIDKLIDIANRLRTSKSKINVRATHENIEEWLDKTIHIENQCAFSYNDLRELIKAPSDKAPKWSEEAYSQLSEWAEAQAWDQSSTKLWLNELQKIPDPIYIALKDFLNVTEYNENHFMVRLPGTYRVYLKSVTIADSYYVGKACLWRSAKSGALMCEILLKNKNISAKKTQNTAYQPIQFRPLTYHFNGAVVYRSGRVFMVTRYASSNSIHCIYLDDRNLRDEEGVAIMKGYFTGSLDDNIYSRKILFERVDHEMISDEMLDLYPKSCLPELVTEYLDNDSSKN